MSTDVRFWVSPEAQLVSDCLLRLPFYNELAEDEQAEVVTAIHEFDSWLHSHLGRAQGPGYQTAPASDWISDNRILLFR